MEPRVSVSKTALEKLEIETFQSILVYIAPIIDSLLADGLPYTKIYAPSAPSQVPQITNAAQMATTLGSA